MFETHRDAVEFFIVYIREAHAIDSSWPMAFAGKGERFIEDPVDLGERAGVASQCVAELNLPMPALLDDMQDTVNDAYFGWPDRLYLVGKDGKIAYAGGRGPFFFAPNRLEAAIQTEIAPR